MRSRSTLLLVIVVALAGLALAWWGARSPRPQRPRGTASSTRLPALDGAAWPGGRPLTADSLGDRPVVLLLWSDTDPASLAALTVADAWHRAFSPFGARVVAMHVARFGFAADSSAVIGIARRNAYALPMADDAEGSIETALGGPGPLPRVIVAASGGQVKVDAVADMAAGERALRELIRESHPDASLPPALDTALPAGVRTIELGAGRVRGGPLRNVPAGEERLYTAQFRYQEQGRPWVPYPVGGWRARSEGLTSTRGGAADFLAIRYSAGRAGVVASPPPGGSARLWVLRDDRWPRPEECDQDVALDERGGASVLVTEPRVYWIDRGEGERVLKLSPETAGVTVNAFVFTGAR